MSNLFEDENSDYLVLRNHENQHSLWPAALEVPAGWETVYGPGPRQDCLDHVEKSWTDMRPASLVAATADEEGGGQR